MIKDEDNSIGTRLGREIRNACNKMSNEERQEALEKSMLHIYRTIFIEYMDKKIEEIYEDTLQHRGKPNADYYKNSWECIRELI